MDIKPIQLVPKIQKAELPDARIGRAPPKVPNTQLKLPTGQWQFIGAKLTLNGQDVGKLVTASQSPIFLSKLAEDLSVYMNRMLMQPGRKKRKKSNISKKGEVEEADDIEGIEQIVALAEAYIQKIMRLLKRKYDETADGLSFTLDEDNQLILNGMNVNAFILMSREYPSQKAKIFLKGFKNRLGIILTNKQGSPSYDKIYEVSLKLFDQIDMELKRIVDSERLIGR